MAIDATDFGYVSTLRDEPDDLAAQTSVKVGGYCYSKGLASSAMNPGDIIVVDTATANSFKTTTSANATTVAGYVVAGLGTGLGAGMQWDYVSAIASGQQILILLKGVVKATASTSISIGARVGTSTTAGRVVTTTTQDASKGLAISAATTAGDTVYVLV